MKKSETKLEEKREKGKTENRKRKKRLIKRDNEQKT